VFISTCHQSLSWATCIQSTTSHSISQRSILIIFFHLHLPLPCCLFPSVFPIKILYTFVISPMHSTCTTHLILLHLMTLIVFGEAFNLWSSSLFSLLQPPTTSSFIKLQYSPQHPVIIHP
jgi:hypothetical protein